MFHIFIHFLLKENCHIPVNENNQYNQGQDVGRIEANPYRELDALAHIGFGDEVVPAPAVTAYAEQQINEAAQREQVVADKEVFQIEHTAAFTHRLEAAPQVEAQYAGQAEQDDGNDVEANGFVAVPFGQFADTGRNVFEHGDDRGHGRKQHEQEEQGAPQLTACHGVEYVWQRDVEQVGAGIRFDAKAEACREDDEAADDGYKGVEHHDVNSFAGQALFFADVTAKNGKCADAQAERKERLAHRCKDNLAHAVLSDFAEVGVEVIAQAFGTVRKHDGVGCKRQHEEQQANHHHLGDAFYACLNAQVANSKAG